MSITKETSQIFQLLSVKELAKMMMLSKRQIHRLNSCGKLGPTEIRIGGSLRFSAQECADWLAAGAPNRKTWEATKNV